MLAIMKELSDCFGVCLCKLSIYGCVRSLLIMGIFLSCCRDSSSEATLIAPDIETKRRMQAEAAERRLREQQSRGIKDPQRLKEKLEKMEKRQENAERLADSHALKWTVD